MIPVLAIPHLNRIDLLERCIRSIDHEIETLVIVDNSNNLQCVQEWFPSCVAKRVFIGHPNIGVAGSWNEAIKTFPAPYWMLCNDDVQFVPGALKEMERVCNETKDKAVGIVANHGASFWTVTQRGIIKAGLFDENFFPAYLEDIDWFYRVKLLKETMVQATEVKVEHGLSGVGAQTMRITPLHKKENDRTYANNCEYYRQKWGGLHRFEQFSNPFNDQTWPVDVWRFEPQMRKINQWKT